MGACSGTLHSLSDLADFTWRSSLWRGRRALFTATLEEGSPVKLWLVVYYFGKIGGAWGPLDYSVDDCARREALNNQQVAINIDAFRKTNPTISPSDIRFSCVYSDRNPAEAE
jgi:hypothetical protein